LLADRVIILIVRLLASVGTFLLHKYFAGVAVASSIHTISTTLNKNYTSLFISHISRTTIHSYPFFVNIYAVFLEKILHKPTISAYNTTRCSQEEHNI